MFFRYGHPMDQMDGTGRRYVEHIWPLKYDSRLTVVSRICDALEKLKIISICGNGATSLAKKLVAAVKRKGSFPTVAMVTVSRNPNLKNIRNGILQQIGGTQIDNCLLIFDGFWWELKNNDFRTIGIPSPSVKFRIVFTSRNVDVCKIIGSHQIHHIYFLEDEKSWDLFREIAGIKSVFDLDFTETARKIVDECDGFHIAILATASALKDKPVDVWKDSLRSLQKFNQQFDSLNIDLGLWLDDSSQTDNSADMQKVLSLIELSYNLLNDEEAQSIFRICCLFPEGFNIPVEYLALFSKGLEIFENVDSMDQARDRVEGIIHKLKKSFFLVDNDSDDFVKVHYICLDFGVSLSSNLMHPYFVSSENSMKVWPLGTMHYADSRAISIMCKTIEQHPVDLKCPNLHLLQLSYGSNSAQLPNGMFEGLRNLRVLSLSIPSLSQPLSVLKKLRALCITESRSENRYMTPRPRIGDLLGNGMKDLEIFSFSTTRPYRDFPREIGLLHNLRYLRFNLERIKYIPAGVLSKLIKLEELYLPLDFISWGCREEGGERMNASLSEIESLHLTALDIGIAKGSILAETLVEKLRRFHVFIGSHISPEYEFGTHGNSKRSLEVFDVDADEFTVSWISALVWKSEILRLKQVRNLKSVITWQWQPTENRIPQWRKICISDCKELEYLVLGRSPWLGLYQLESLKLFGLCNMKNILNALYLSKTFGNLCEIQIMFCVKLKYVFPVSVATELRQLQSLQVCFCDEMEGIFYRERTNNEGNQVAGQNASKGSLQLRDSMPETTSMTNRGFYHKSKLFSLTSNSITKRLFGRRKQAKNLAHQLQMEETSEIIFPRLKKLEFAYMDKLRVFYNGNDHVNLLPSLESLSMFHCNHLEAFSYGSLETPLLQKIQIDGNQYAVTEDLNAVLENLNRVVMPSNAKLRNDHGILLPSLESLSIFQSNHFGSLFLWFTQNSITSTNTNQWKSVSGHRRSYCNFEESELRKD